MTVGTTLAVNALVQGRADRVALALSAGLVWRPPVSPSGTTSASCPAVWTIVAWK